MGSRFGREFLKFEVRETDEGVGYWLDRPWVDAAQRPGLLAAQIVAVPDHGADDGPMFPEGSGDFLARFREVLGDTADLAVAIRSSEYQELALHSKAWRLPTLILKYGIFPIALNIFANRLDELLPGHQKGDTAEMTLIIEGPNHKALKLEYKGDPAQMVPMLQSAIPKFIDQLDAAPVSPHQVHPNKRRQSAAD
jgi:hypothetical protein